MKGFTILFFSIFFMSCMEKGRVTPSAKPTGDTLKAAPVNEIQNMVYDDTGKYFGLMTNSMPSDAFNNYPFYDTDHAFLFYVTYTAQNTIMFFSSKGVILSYYNGDPDDIVGGIFNINNNNSYATYSDSFDYYTFRIVKDSLYASWCYTRDIVGSCDDQGTCQGEFAGIVKPHR